MTKRSEIEEYDHLHKRSKPLQALEAILLQIDGVERALVDMDDGEVKIVFNETQVNQEKIKKRIQQHGLHLLEKTE